jgi:hypothetical protein
MDKGQVIMQTPQTLGTYLMPSNGLDDRRIVVRLPQLNDCAWLLGIREDLETGRNWRQGARSPEIWDTLISSALKSKESLFQITWYQQVRHSFRGILYTTCLTKIISSAVISFQIHTTNAVLCLRPWPGEDGKRRSDLVSKISRGSGNITDTNWHWAQMHSRRQPATVCAAPGSKLLYRNHASGGGLSNLRSCWK